MNTEKDLYLFFDRPTEPIFMKKGEEKAVFDLPDNYFPEKYEGFTTELSNRFSDDSGRTINVKTLDQMPDLTGPLQLNYSDRFSLFINTHKTWAGELIATLMNMRDLEDLKSILAYCQMRVNPYMLNYCLSVTMLHRRDTKGMTIPALSETFPDKFVDPKVFQRAREVASSVPEKYRFPITIPVNYTASDLEPEQRVAYFREDIGINLHHWHWHLVYPTDVKGADSTIVDKDRRGELFYYMHSQIISRYNFERYCNNLAKALPFEDFDEPIKEGYFPKLDSKVGSRTWAPRFSGTKLSDVVRPIEEIQVTVHQLKTWRDRIVHAIESGFVVNSKGRNIPLDEEKGMNIIGNIIEASALSVNRNVYGDFHNMGHILSAYSHDPDNRHLERHGVMGDVATAMRDPFFYRWHTHIDNLCQLYKNKLAPYTRDVLNFPGITVSSISVESSGAANTFSTFREQNTMDLANGLDFAPRNGDKVLATFQHLQHDDCHYVITVNNTTGKGATGTFRIFMAPVNDEKGNVLPFSEQRRLMIELDKFSQPLKTGSNTIRRSSVESSVTIPFDKTFRDQSQRPGKEGGLVVTEEFDFCGCGWPHHMLFPRGTTAGFPVVLYVMVSNSDVDLIKQDLVGNCNKAASFCGLRDRKYPDKRAMGFPFDRLPQANVKKLSDFLTPNMATRDCIIKFTDTTRITPYKK